MEVTVRIYRKRKLKPQCEIVTVDKLNKAKGASRNKTALTKNLSPIH